MSDTTARDQLAQIIYDTLDMQYGDFCTPGDAAEAIIEAGWRPSVRFVKEFEELLDLPAGSVVLDAFGEAHQSVRFPAGLRWTAFLSKFCTTRDLVQNYAGHFMVLSVPNEEK